MAHKFLLVYSTLVIPLFLKIFDLFSLVMIPDHESVIERWPFMKGPLYFFVRYISMGRITKNCKNILM